MVYSGCKEWPSRESFGALMTVLTELQKIESSLNGSKITKSEAADLAKNLPPELLPMWLMEALQNYPLSGVCFSLDEDDDESGLGADLKWFAADQMIEEALSAYPGKVVLKLGYLPVALCLAGSGDPYFLKMADSNLDDPVLVRIPHDLVAEDDSYPESEIEVVCNSLSRFFNLSQID